MEVVLGLRDSIVHLTKGLRGERSCFFEEHLVDQDRWKKGRAMSQEASREGTRSLQVANVMMHCWQGVGLSPNCVYRWVLCLLCTRIMEP